MPEPFRWFGKVPKSWLPFQLAVVGAWAVIITVFIATCGESEAEREARLAAEAQEEAKYAAEAKIRADERTAKLERLRKETCTPEKERAFEPIIGDRVGLGVTVDPLIWGQLAYVQRVGIAGWVSLCMFDGETAFIKHWQTGENLAMWSIDLGYVNTE